MSMSEFGTCRHMRTETADRIRWNRGPKRCRLQRTFAGKPKYKKPQFESVSFRNLLIAATSTYPANVERTPASTADVKPLVSDPTQKPVCSFTGSCVSRFLTP